MPPEGKMRIKWDIYEAVILLDGYLEVLQARQPKARIVKRVSEDLRRMAINRGIKIDDIYRNENGISYQIQSMDSAYKGEKIYVPASRLFKETVELYHTDGERYFKILEEAKKMAVFKGNDKADFLAQTVPMLSAREEQSLSQPDFKITYERRMKAMPSFRDNDEKATVLTERNAEIIAVLKQHYKYGFKYDSIREFMRFRQLADAMEIDLPKEDEVLKDCILSSGTVIGDKVYCKNDDMSQELWRIVEDAFSTGAGVIYYEKLFENEQRWMESYTITSPDMLKEYLQKNIVGCSFSKKFMNRGDKRSEKEIVTNELKRIWGANPLENVDNLCSRLPYIPTENIWRVISGNDFFVRSSEGEYLLIDRFRITEEEEKDILEFVDGNCEKKGFVSLNDIPLGDIEEENYELTRLVIYNAIYKKILSDKYQLNEKILTRENSKIGAIVLLKQYLKDKDECTFDEIADKVEELTGSINRQYAFQALYDDMVRVDKNRFVAGRCVDFPVDEIDNALSKFITDNFRAICDVATFVMFPLCGQSWNHYLLESFCYKYSKRYRLHVIHFNDKNAGIIAEKDFHRKYDEMLAIALVRADVELSTEIVGQYLFDTGYMAKRKYDKLEEIVRRALELQKERR